MSERSLKRNHEEEELSRSLKQRTYESSLSKSNYERKLLSFETSKREFEITMREKNVQHSKLLKDLAWYKDKAENEQREKEAAQSLLIEKKVCLVSEYIHTSLILVQSEYDKSHSQLKHSLMNIKEENVLLKSENESINSNCQRQLQSKDTIISSLTRRCASLEEDLQSATETSNQRQSLLESTRKSLEELEQDRSSANLDSSHAYTSFMRDELSKQTSLNRKLESTNKTLTRELESVKEKASRFDVAREENMTLQSKLKVLDRLNQQVSILELERDVLIKEKESWSTVLEPGESPSSITNVVAQLRLENVSLKEKLGTSSADQTGHNSELSELLEGIENLKKIEKEQKISIENLSKTAKSQVRLLELSQQETSLVKKQLDSIISEEEMLSSQKFDSLQKERINSLEDLLQQHKSENEKLSKDILNLSKTTDTTNENALKLKVSQAEQALENIKLEAQEEINKLGQEVVALEHKVGRGEFNIKTTRVLEMRDNPISQDYAIRSETLNALKEENRLLLEKLKNGGGNASSSDSAQTGLPQQTMLNLSKEKETLERQLSDKDKRMLRLKNIFSDKAVEFREAIYSLLGYKVQFLPNGRVRLNSAYHTPPDGGGILFQSNDNDQGTMKVEDGSLEGIEDLLKFWVNERESIPCFMANLCLELWDASKRGEIGRLAVR